MKSCIKLRDKMRAILNVRTRNQPASTMRTRMRSRLFIFAGGILWLTGVLHAADFVGDPRFIPLHPTVIMAEYKNGFRPVVDVDRQDPQVDNEGELKQLLSKNF